MELKSAAKYQTIFAKKLGNAVKTLELNMKMQMRVQYLIFTRPMDVIARRWQTEQRPCTIPSPYTNFPDNLATFLANFPLKNRNLTVYSFSWTNGLINSPVKAQSFSIEKEVKTTAWELRFKNSKEVDSYWWKFLDLFSLLCQGEEKENCVYEKQGCTFLVAILIN